MVYAEPDASTVLWAPRAARERGFEGAPRVSMTLHERSSSIPTFGVARMPFARAAAASLLRFLAHAG